MSDRPTGADRRLSRSNSPSDPGQRNAARARDRTGRAAWPTNSSSLDQPSRSPTSDSVSWRDVIMRSPHRSSRRDFVRLAGLAAGAGRSRRLVRAGRPTGRSARPGRRCSPGCSRATSGSSRGSSPTRGGGRRTSRALAEGQAPLAIIVGCADSRVAPELVFDQGVGDLFVVRVAGNIVSGAGPTVKGSIEFAVAELGARLIMVLGHSQCGAVKAAIAAHRRQRRPARVDRRPRRPDPAGRRRGEGQPRRQARQRHQGQRREGRRAAQGPGSDPVQVRQDGRTEGGRRRLRTAHAARSRSFG